MFKDNNFHSIRLLNPQNIGVDIHITFLVHLVLEISLLLQKSCCCGHLGGHLEFWSLHKWDSRGLLICYLWVYYGLILKKLACYEFCSPPTLMLLDYKETKYNNFLCLYTNLPVAMTVVVPAGCKRRFRRDSVLCVTSARSEDCETRNCGKSEKNGNKLCKYLAIKKEWNGCCHLANSRGQGINCHCIDLVTQKILVSGNGLVPDGTNPLPDPMLTYYH